MYNTLSFVSYFSKHRGIYGFLKWQRRRSEVLNMKLTYSTNCSFSHNEGKSVCKTSMKQPLCSINRSLLHGTLNGNVCKILCANYHRTFIQCYINTENRLCNSIPQNYPHSLNHEEKVNTVISDLISSGILQDHNKDFEDLDVIRQLVNVLVGNKVQKNVIKKLLRINSSLCKKMNPQRWHNSIVLLKNCGFETKDICTILSSSATIFDVPENEIIGVVDTLRHLGFRTDQICKTCLYNPNILLTNNKKLYLQFQNLLQYFAKSDVFRIMKSNPNVFTEDWNVIETKLMYVIDEMGLDIKKHVINTNFFRHSLEHINIRHLFLDKVGLYFMPNNQGITTQENPSIRAIFDTKDKYFCKNVAGGLTVDEYKTFKDMYMLYSSKNKSLRYVKDICDDISSTDDESDSDEDDIFSSSDDDTSYYSDENFDDEISYESDKSVEKFPRRKQRKD